MGLFVIRDKVGNKIEVGCLIAYAISGYGNAPALSLGLVKAVKIDENSNSKITVQGFFGRNNTKQSRLSTLTCPERIIVLDPERMSEDLYFSLK